jgi:hypothetical protein
VLLLKNKTKKKQNKQNKQGIKKIGQKNIVMVGSLITCCGKINQLV